jgi:hypothetical protein
MTKHIAQAADRVASRRACGNDHREIRKCRPEAPAGDARRLGNSLVGIGQCAETYRNSELRCRRLRERRFQHGAA